MVLMVSLPLTTVVTSPEAALEEASLEAASLEAALEAGAEAAELLEEEPPQAARDRARQRAVAIAICFFMLDFSFFKWGRAGPVPSEKPEAGGFCAARASSPAGCF